VYKLFKNIDMFMCSVGRVICSLALVKLLEALLGIFGIVVGLCILICLYHTTKRIK